MAMDSGHPCFTPEVNVKEFFTKKTGVIRNFNKLASGVNQFFPTMLKTKISSGVSSEGATSIYDHFKEDDLRDKFKKAMLRGLFRDSMYSFGKKIKLRHLTKDCHKLLSKTGQLVVDSDDDPDYQVAADYGVKLGVFGNGG